VFACWRLSRMRDRDGVGRAVRGGTRSLSGLEVLARSLIGLCRSLVRVCFLVAASCSLRIARRNTACKAAERLIDKWVDKDL
jgi:hypothetical protein